MGALQERWLRQSERARPLSRPLFIKWLILQALTISAAIPAVLFYNQGIHPVALVAVGLVLSVYGAATAYCGFLCWNERRRGVNHVDLAIQLCPMIAMLGTASGFLIAFSGDISNVQQRVTGASTGIIATVIGVACTILLMVQRHMVDEG